MTTFGDHQAAIAAEALALRRLARFKAARVVVEHNNGHLDNLPDVTDFNALEQRYSQLVRELVGHMPETPAAEVACLELLENILADAMARSTDGALATEEEDMGAALAIVQVLAEAANERAIEVIMARGGDPEGESVHFVN